jgi:hypothetical protein
MFDLVVVRDAVERRTKNRLETRENARGNGRAPVQERPSRLGSGRALARRIVASARSAAASMSIGSSSSEASASIESSCGS